MPARHICPLLQLDQSARYNGKGASENYEAAVKALSDVVSFLAGRSHNASCDLTVRD